MSGAPSADGTVTYRGRSLEEVLPQIREELGPDAIIERQRTGLVGGVGGFFQREMVEIDARPAAGLGAGAVDVLAGGQEDELRAATAPPRDDALAEGLSSPGMRRIAEQSEPFAGLLADAEHDVLPPRAGPSPDWAAWAADDDADLDDDLDDEDDPRAAAPSPEPALEPEAPPAPRLAAPPRGIPAAYGGPQRSETPAPPRFFSHEPAGPAVTAATVPSRPPAADAHERALVEHGLSAELAASVVGEAVAHAAPFGPARGGLKRQVRATLARRIPVQSGFGDAGRTLALVGPAGAGKTRTAAGLAAAYAAGSELPVVTLSLRPPDVGAELASLLEPHSVAVRPVQDGASARAHVGTRAGRALVVVDTPATSPRDRQAIAALAGDLRAAGVTEAHVVLPATMAAPVARAALAAFGPVSPAALLLTHGDETDHIGPLVELAIEQGLPLSFLVSGPSVGADLQPADPAAVAARLLP